MSTACAMSLTRMEEGRWDGVERNRSARWIGRGSHASGIYFPHTRARPTYTCGDSGPASCAGHSDSLTMRSLTMRGATNGAFV
jgi:hypothetical protein